MTIIEITVKHKPWSHMWGNNDAVRAKLLQLHPEYVFDGYVSQKTNEDKTLTTYKIRVHNRKRGGPTVPLYDWGTYWA